LVFSTVFGIDTQSFISSSNIFISVLLQSWVENREHSFLRRLASIMAQPA